MFEQSDIQGTDVLDHLGLVVATIDKLGIVKKIDQRLPMTKGAKTTYGQRAMAMILNGLGFMDDRLYLFPKFLENKPVARLFSKNLCATDFNDDALGRFLDKLEPLRDSIYRHVRRTCQPNLCEQNCFTVSFRSYGP